MSDEPKKCHRCGSTNTIPYSTKPPPPKRNGFHRCDETCIIPAILCLNCRMAREFRGGTEK